MKDHSVYVVYWTKRESIGSWISWKSTWKSHREWRHESWGDPIEHKTYYLAPSEEIVMAHWKKGWELDSKLNPENAAVLIRCEKIDDAHVILELK